MYPDPAAEPALGPSAFTQDQFFGLTALWNDLCLCNFSFGDGEEPEGGKERGVENGWWGAAWML